MSVNNFNRRDFLKLMGWGGVGTALVGCDAPSYITLEEGKEEVVAYLMPEEYAIPGVGVWFASTCTQCAAGCGVHGRVREGRVLKMEGNPASSINAGRLCQMGQAGLQNHYNPDRIYKPMVRKGGSLQEVTWEEALAALTAKVGSTATVAGERVAWMTGTVSGHQSVLLSAYLGALGSTHHYVHEQVNNAVARAANQDMLGEAQPAYLLDKAKVVLSFGADLLGASVSPVNFAGQYAKFRTATPRGMMIQVESSMSLTGGNADLWLAAKPGTEGVFAYGIANELINAHGLGASVPENVRAVLSSYSAEKVGLVTGIPVERIAQVAKILKERSPSLVLTGAAAEQQTHGYQTAAAATLLNIILGNVGQTIVSRGVSPFPDLEAKTGGTRDLLAFAEATAKNSYDIVFIANTNPAYTAPAALQFEEKLKAVPFKVVFSQFMDETARHADVLLPLASGVEDWGTHVAAYQPAGRRVIGIQQPLMEPLQSTTKGFGDIMLALLKMRQPEQYNGFEDYYAYLQKAFTAMPVAAKGGALTDVAFWRQAMQKGVIELEVVPGTLNPVIGEIKPIDVVFKEGAFRLSPSVRLGFWDGRHANLPWLQEAPDQINKTVWTTAVEMHPVTAKQLGVMEGDFVRVTSASSSFEAQVYAYRGIYPGVIAVVVGQGHEEYGRYAKGRGANVLKLLDVVTEAKTGELATHATPVTVAKVGKREVLVKLMGNESQLGRRMVGTVRAEVFQRVEGDKNVV